MKKIAMLVLAALAVSAVCYAAPAPKKAKKGKKVTLTIDFSQKPFKEISSNAKKPVITAEEANVYTVTDAKGKKEYPIEIFNDKGGYFYTKVGDTFGLMFNHGADSKAKAWIKTPAIKGKTLKSIEFVLLNKFAKTFVISSTPSQKGDQVKKGKYYEGNVEHSVSLLSPQPETSYYIFSGDRNLTFQQIVLHYE